MSIGRDNEQRDLSYISAAAQMTLRLGSVSEILHETPGSGDHMHDHPCAGDCTLEPKNPDLQCIYTQGTLEVLQMLPGPCRHSASQCCAAPENFQVWLSVVYLSVIVLHESPLDAGFAGQGKGVNVKSTANQ